MQVIETTKRTHYFIHRTCFCFLCIFKNQNMHISNSLLKYDREKSDVFCVFLPPHILDEVFAANHILKGEKTQIPSTL